MRSIGVGSRFTFCEFNMEPNKVLTNKGKGLGQLPRLGHQSASAPGFSVYSPQEAL